MKILVLCDDRWHPASTVRAGLAPLEQQGFQFDWVEDAGEWSVERMAQYPVVILSKSNNVTAKNEAPWMSEAVEKAFVAYVRQGKGLLVIHSGTAGYQNTPQLRALMGGVFKQHPEQCLVTILPTEGHPLTSGSRSFTLKDEHYFMEVDDPNVEVFVKTTSDHGEQPGAWTRSDGKGRVCVLTPGHNTEVWLHPGFQALLRNTMTWCAGEE